MMTADTRRLLCEFAQSRADQVFRGSPFYKPVGRFYDAGSGGAPDLDGGLGDSSSKSLYFGRLLLACYENEFIYIPDDRCQLDLTMWRSSYCADRLFQSHRIRHLCEAPYFRDFRGAIDVTGEWSLRAFEDYFADYAANLDCADTKAIVARIHASKSPRDAALFHAVQLAAEFLVEASGMTRNLQGYFGPEQSEYFKIVTDEYGYGVHSTKHSTLYRNFVESVELNSRPHHYWWFYLPATLFADNYINMLSTNHRNFFNHLGSLTQNENAFAASLKFFDEMYRELFPRSVTDYFKEHVHIDVHHGRMAFQGLCLSLVKRLGDYLIPEIVRGFEESMLLGKIYRRELTAHLDWVDSIWPETELASRDAFAEDPEFFTTMVDRPVTLTSERGTTQVHIMPRVYRPVAAGESMEIPARVLFGALAERGGSYRIALRDAAGKEDGAHVQH